jgi:hypothetical protein
VIGVVASVMTMKAARSTVVATAISRAGRSVTTGSRPKPTATLAVA